MESENVNEVYKSRSLWEEAFRRLLKNKGAIVGAIFMILLIAAAIAAGFIYDYDTDVIGQNISNRLKWPSREHIFGTDELGRDIFTRVIYGARYSLFIGFGSEAIGLIIGIILGSLAGFHGGWVDMLVMRSADVLYAIPNIMIAVVIVSLLGTSTVNLLIALSVSSITSFARISRAAVLQLRSQEYIESAQAMGLPTWKIIVKHVLPNILAPVIVQITLRVGSTIIAASSLSFLGIGVPSPAPEWGAMLSSGRSQMRTASYICIIPGLAIMFTVLALNLLGDGLRDALDPKLKK